MSWHSIKQAQELTGKSRSTLYRDMNAGRVSYRTESDGRRRIDTAELIRVYGEIGLPETPQRDTPGQGDETLQVMSEMVQELRALRAEVAGLKQELQEIRLLEHKRDIPGSVTGDVTESVTGAGDAPAPAAAPVQRSWWQRFWD